MKAYRPAMSVILAGGFLMAGCGPPQAVEQIEQTRVANSPREAAVPPTEVSIQSPQADATVALQIALPDGWAVNPGFGTLMYEPGNRDDFYEPPSIEIVTAVEGEAAPDAIPENIAQYVQRVKDSSAKIQTGDADLDAQGAHVEIIEETAGAGEWGLTLKLTYPDGVSDAMYPPRIWIYRFLHRADEPFFVLIKGKVPIQEVGQFFAPVSAACKSARRN